jgi:arylsulfatase A-like enzyme
MSLAAAGSGRAQHGHARRGARLRAWILSITALMLCGCADGPEPPARPNLLLIVADDLGYADLGPYGGPIRTPNIDALAGEGVLFTNFHAGPSCAPSRAMLLTGNNNHVAGMGRQNSFIEGLEGYENRLSDRVAPLPRLLSEAGYHTVTAGKWHLGNHPGEAPPSAGFVRSWSMINGAGSHFSDVGFSDGGSTYREDGEEVPWPEGAYSTAHYTDRLLEYMAEARAEGRPFFAYAAYTSPHWPLQVPDEELDRYAGVFDEGYDVWRGRSFERLQAAGIVPPDQTLPPRNDAVPPWDELEPEMRAYYTRAMELYAAMLENLDHHVGRLLDHLKETGEYERTVVVFLSDNGAANEDWWHEGEAHDFIRAHYDDTPDRRGRRGSWVSYGRGWAEAGSAPFSRHKSYTREGGLMAPMIVAGPGVSRGGHLEDAYVTIMDVAPTLLEAAGATYPSDGSVRPMLGTSMAPLLGGTSDHVHDDASVTTVYHGGRAYVRRGPWKLVTLEPPFDESKFELFDVVADPGETRDLRAAEPARYAEMLGLWRSEKARLGIRLESERASR